MLLGWAWKCVREKPGHAFATILSVIFFCAGPQAGVTDNGLGALACAGCGKKLTSLHLYCEHVLSVGAAASGMEWKYAFSHRLLADFATDLPEGVTDEGLSALASAGCGKNLTSLHLACGCLLLSLLSRVWNGSVSSVLL